MADIGGLESTDLFTGSEQRPLQLVRVPFTLRGAPVPRGPGRVHVEGPGVTTPRPTTVTGPAAAASHTAEVAVEVDSALAEGTTRRVTVIVDTEDTRTSVDADLTVAAPGWTMFMVPHFHYDPVWWNTQAGLTATWYDLGPHAVDPAGPMRTAFDLVGAHLAKADDDSDYKFVLAELDYLKPYWDAHPRQRHRLRDLLAQGRLEIVGGTYNEPNTNLTTPETTIRNAVYGIGHQRDVLGANPRSAWMLDSFGHDPAFPSLMSQAGLTSSAWARGPFHQWGPKLTVGDNHRMQFPSEFEWVSPDGNGLLTSYMPNHYIAGWQLHVMPDLARAREHAYLLFAELKAVAATRNVMLPVGADHVIPSQWATEVQRDWNSRYLWPRFVVGLPAEFFAAVRAHTGEDRRRRAGTTTALRPQSRDMNPIYTGKDVSYIDTKQAQRAAETSVIEAEKLATLAGLLGSRYPAEALDKAWRQLLFGAHHDGITGTESDQVYLDLLGGWREAHELADAVRAAAVDHLGACVDTRTGGTVPAGRPIIVVNTLSWPRSDLARITLGYPAPGPPGVDVRDEHNRRVPAVTEAARTHADDTLAEVTLCFLAREVPATGYRTYRVVAADVPPQGWSVAAGDVPAVDNATFRVEVDPAYGGTLARILDKRTGTEVLRGGGNEMALYDEYREHPDFGEGPWHLLPTGPALATSAQVPATVVARASPLGQQLVTSWELEGLRVTQEVTLTDGIERVDCVTHVDGQLGCDRLLRVRFPANVAGGRPVYEVGNAAVGRSFGFPDVDAAATPWTLDNPALRWCALSSAVRVALTDGGVTRLRHAIGVAEIVAPEAAEGDGVRELVAALAAQGATATTTRPDGPRYGASDLDSNLPDVRLSVGGPEQNPFTAEVLTAADPAYHRRLRDQLDRYGAARLWVPAARGRAETWVPGADLRGARALPVLIVATAGDTLAGPLNNLVTDLADATVDVDQPGELDGTSEPLTDYSVALVNRGTPGCVVDTSGTMHMSLMRACSGWPSGVWVDPPQRTTPDGGSFAWQHWSHTFRYSLVAGSGDWRQAGFVRHGHEVNHPLQVREIQPGDAVNARGPLPVTASLVEVEPVTVVLSAFKPHGNPMARGRRGDTDPREGVTLRCYETHGQTTDATVRLRWPLEAATRTDLLEQAGDGATDPAVSADGALRLTLGAAGTATLTAVAHLDRPDTQPSQPSAGPGPGRWREPAQPVFTRYWLHNKGAAPVGNMPVSVNWDADRLHLDDASGRSNTARVTVASGATEETRSGHVELMVPPGVTLEPAGPLPYQLEPGGHTDVEVTVRAGMHLAGGHHLLAARIADELGQELADSLELRVGAPPQRPRLTAHLLTSSLHLGVGTSAHIELRLDNDYQDTVHGEAQLLSPYGTWEMLRPWSRGFTVAAQSGTTVRFDACVPAAARPGSFWALVKVMYHGRLAYTPAIPIEVTAT